LDCRKDTGKDGLKTLVVEVVPDPVAYVQVMPDFVSDPEPIVAEKPDAPRNDTKTLLPLLLSVEMGT
jgi:hypothetical protein